MVVQPIKRYLRVMRSQWPWCSELRSRGVEQHERRSSCLLDQSLGYFKVDGSIQCRSSITDTRG